MKIKMSNYDNDNDQNNVDNDNDDGTVELKLGVQQSALLKGPLFTQSEQLERLQCIQSLYQLFAKLLNNHLNMYGFYLFFHC